MGLVDMRANQGWEHDASAGDGTTILRRKMDHRPRHERLADGWSKEGDAWSNYPAGATAETQAIADKYRQAVGALRALDPNDPRIREINMLDQAAHQAELELYEALTRDDQPPPSD
jgi:hypothetical protein